jgi:chromosome segregation ATPase
MNIKKQIFDKNLEAKSLSNKIAFLQNDIETLKENTQREREWSEQLKHQFTFECRNKQDKIDDLMKMNESMHEKLDNAVLGKESTNLENKIWKDDYEETEYTYNELKARLIQIVNLSKSQKEAHDKKMKEMEGLLESEKGKLQEEKNSLDINIKTLNKKYTKEKEEWIIEIDSLKSEIEYLSRENAEIEERAKSLKL